MTYRTTVSADSPAVWWHLDETTGTSFVDSIGGLNATVTGSPTLNQASLSLDTDKAVTFATTSLQYAERANNATFRPSNMSVEVLIRSRGVTGNNRIVENGADDCWSLSIESGQLRFIVFGHASAQYTWPGGSGRHHVVGTYDSTLGRAILYVDGVQVGIETSTSGAPSATAGTLRIAQKPGGSANSDGWNGTLDEVAIYSSVLTPTKVAQHAAAANLSSSTLSFAGYTWTVAERAAADPFVNGFGIDQAFVDGSGMHLKIDPLGGGYSAGAEVALPSSLGYGTYTCVISGNVSTMHSNAVWGGLFTFGGDAAYGHREIDANEQSKWSGSTATLSHSVWMPSSATDIYANRGGYNAAGNMTTQTASSHTAVLVWSPGKVTMRLYTGTTVNPANLFRESIVSQGDIVTFNIEAGGTYTGPATIPVPLDETVHFNLWVCPNYGGGGDPATVTATEIIVTAFTFAPIATLSGSGPLHVGVDWDRDGAFTSFGEDVTLDQRGTVVATYGRDGSTALSQVSAGRGSFDLDNTSRRYSSRNASSPLFGKVKPARPVLISRDVTVSGSTTTFTIFRGHSDDQPLNPDVDAQRVTMNLVDYLQDLRGITITTPVYQGVRSGAAIGYILDAAGWTGGRDIDVGASQFPWWWEDGTDALDALQKVVASEGPPALLSVDVNGGIVFRDRHHRLTRSASKTSQSTFRGTDGAAEPVMGRGFGYSEGWANVVNSPMFTVGERAPAEVAPVWESDDVFTIAASQSYVVVLTASDPFLRAVTPVVKVSEDSDGDYTILAGGIASVSLSRDSGQSTSITFTATGAGATVSGVRLRAQSLAVARSWQITASAAARTTANTAQSVLDYGQRGVPSGLEPVWASRYDAQALADLYVLQRAQPLTILSVRFIASDLQQLRLSKVLALDLSDRVTVIETESQVNADFYVESISHTIDGQVSHEIVIGLEAVPALPGSAVFILGTSTLNGTDPLGY